MNITITRLIFDRLSVTSKATAQHTNKRTHFDNTKYFSKNVAKTIDLMNLGEVTVLKNLQLQDT